jgi:primase-polymerase (primpol)-like protein
LADTALLAKAKAARRGEHFAALLAGNWDGYASHSEADMGLCVRLAFWSQDPAQIDRLFRQSGLMRDKWDVARGAQTYGARTIAEALARQTEHYQSGAASPVVGRDANIARYRAQIHADPYFGASDRRGTGITPAVLVTEQEMIHG